MAGFSDFHNDPTIRFDHTPITSKFAFALNHVGAHDSDAIDVATFTPSDTNSIFVNDTTGNDTTGDGTQSTPYKTILKGINSTTALLTYVVITDSVLYVEDLSSATTTFFQGMYALSGQTPTWTSRLLGYTPADANSIFFGATSGTPGGTGTQADPADSIAGAVALTDGTHQNIVEVDGDTYQEESIEMVSNFLGMYAADGVKPTYKPIPDIDYFSTDLGYAFTQLACCELVAGGFVVVGHNRDGDLKVWHAIFDQTGTIVGSWVDMGASTNGSVSCCGLTGGGYVVAHYRSSGTEMVFLRYNSSGVQQGSTTVFYTNPSTGTSTCAGLNNGGFAIGYSESPSDNETAVVKLYNSSGSLQTTINVLSTNGHPKDIYTLTNDNFVVVYSDDDNTQLMADIYSEAGVQQGTSIVVSGTNLQTNGEAGCTEVGSSGFVVCYYDTDDSNKGKFKIYNSSGVIVGSEETFSSDGASNIACRTLDTGDFIITANNTTDSTNELFRYDNSGNATRSPYVFTQGTDNKIAVLTSNQYVIVSTISGDDIFYLSRWNAITISDDSEINGWIIDCVESEGIHSGFDLDASTLDLKWITLENIKSNIVDDDITAYAAIGDDEINIYNSILEDGGFGITVTADKAIIQDSQFIRFEGGYAIHIDGAAASSGDITIEHCDLFQNYAGIYLENNHGTNEIVKNNIYHNNSNEAIKADTAVTISYSVRTDGLENVSDGTAVLFSNPLYLNEGAISEALTDLHIKTVIEGYPTDSPAKDQADDDRNSGSYDVRYIGSATTWTSITIDKPLHGTFGVDYNPVGGNKSIGSEGSIEYTKKGQTLMLTLTYDGMVNDEFDDVLGMWASDESTARVYPDPVTNPNTYETFKMIREKLKGSAGNYKLTRTGKEGIKLVFERKFEA